VTTSRPWLGISAPAWLKESDAPQPSAAKPKAGSGGTYPITIMARSAAGTATLNFTLTGS